MENSWDKRVKGTIAAKPFNRLAKHTNVLQRCGPGGKSHLHLTGSDRPQLAPWVRWRRVQRKRSVNKIRASDFRAETLTKGSS